VQSPAAARRRLFRLWIGEPNFRRRRRLIVAGARIGTGAQTSGAPTGAGFAIL
jgi:MoxR-like ATPase